MTKVEPEVSLENKKSPNHAHHHRKTHRRKTDSHAHEIETPLVEPSEDNSDVLFPEVTSEPKQEKTEQKPPEIKKSIFDIHDPDEEVLTYAQTLHNALKIMWFPMVLMGRLPFWLSLKKHRAVVQVKCSFPYCACFSTCIISWALFGWLTAGFIYLAGRVAMRSDSLKNEVTSSVSVYLARRYWVDVFIFWTTLLQACVSSTHILYNARKLAGFVSSWYRVLDTTKVEVARTLSPYIIKNMVGFVLILLAIIIMFCSYPWTRNMEAAGEIIVIAFAQPIIYHQRLKDSSTRFEDGQFFFQKYAAVGLCIYLMAVMLSWLYIMQFMVFCRCFRKGLKSINERIAMVLEVDDVKRIGPNALRLSYEEVHRDYLGIATTGIKIGKIFSWTMCNYYLWSTLVLVVEVGEIFKFAKRDYRSVGYLSEGDKILGQNGFPEVVHPVQDIMEALTHLVMTSFCIFYVSHEASGAYKEGKRAYELARYRGLVDCTSNIERNFIRSIWIVVSDKVPVHISPGKFFGITNSTVLTVFATAFTYFIFWVQSLGQLAKLEGELINS